MEIPKINTIVSALCRLEPRIVAATFRIPKGFTWRSCPRAVVSRNKVELKGRTPMKKLNFYMASISNGGFPPLSCNWIYPHPPLSRNELPSCLTDHLSCERIRFVAKLLLQYTHSVVIEKYPISSAFVVWLSLQSEKLYGFTDLNTETVMDTLN